MPLLALVAAMLATGCNSLFGIHEGTPRPMCTDGLMIDDMEDGDESICRTNGRTGVWYDFGDGTPTGDLTPKSTAPFTPTGDGSRGSSQNAARFAGSGFTVSGAGMGFLLMNPPGDYDAGGLGGITFWMRSNVPVSVDFSTSDTTPIEDGGDCVVDCNQHFRFQLTAPAPGWFLYQVPFNALSGGGSAIWNPRHLFGVTFRVPPGTAFEVWIDDVAFYKCAERECQPTCTDPQYPVSCRIGNALHSSCRPTGTHCSAVADGIPRPCTLAQTMVAPADGLIANFTEPYAGIGILAYPVGSTSAPTYTTAGGGLHITLDRPATSVPQYVGVVVGSRENCIDATAFVGVQFTISGSISGCMMQYCAGDDAHQDVTSGATYATGPEGSYQPRATITATQITSIPRTMKMPFSDQTGGSPATPIDRARLILVAWQFTVDATTSSTPGSCIADLTIDDVRFY